MDLEPRLLINPSNKTMLVDSLRPSDAYMHHETIIGYDSGLPPGQRQAIIETNARILFMDEFHKCLLCTNGGL